MRRPAVRLAILLAATTLLSACADVAPTGPSAPRGTTDTEVKCSQQQGSQTCP